MIKKHDQRIYRGDFLLLDFFLLNPESPFNKGLKAMQTQRRKKKSVGWNIDVLIAEWNFIISFKKKWLVAECNTQTMKK